MSRFDDPAPAPAKPAPASPPPKPAPAKASKPAPNGKPSVDSFLRQFGVELDDAERANLHCVIEAAKADPAINEPAKSRSPSSPVIELAIARRLRGASILYVLAGVYDVPASTLKKQQERWGIALAQSRWAYLPHGGSFYDRWTRKLVSERDTVADAREYFSLSSETDTKNVLRTRTQKYYAMSNLPGRPAEYRNEDGARVLNVFKPWRLEAVAGDASPIVNHIEWLCGGVDRARPLLQNLAYMIQNPGKRCKWAPVIVSDEEGVGKDTLAYALELIIGADNLTRPSNAELANEQRNTFITEGHVVILNEACHGSRLTVIDNLKPLITETRARVNAKYQNPIMVEHCAVILIFSNRKDALAIDERSRRFYVIFADQEPKEAEYYTRLYHWLENENGAAIFRHYLETLPLEGFNPHAAPPKTDAMAEMALLALTAKDIAIRELMSRREAPFACDLIRLEEALIYLRDIREIEVSPAQLQRVIKGMGGKSLGPVNVRKDGATSKLRLWAIRDAARWLSDDDSGDNTMKRGLAYLGADAHQAPGYAQAGAEVRAWTQEPGGVLVRGPGGEWIAGASNITSLEAARDAKAHGR